ncbi:Gpi16 subunit GPI transamidase component [Coniophora puteana RWD-64-598 SS2]|uniref:Gpi16 subunit GPI transamidase component n=1 Tax=Coniophora puteana (strain RWD-64-598) TaxID=741705 RepID=A0A5M3MGX8_CONPW|nr:Gpi16 subunit GPI transamidase component [Coniophora puteana RWD-64-598 SS2]EIW78363.1 Gpi16 subunit GPI transamidase component [Coniophora puteana RWD-64-598 SS2]
MTPCAFRLTKCLLALGLFSLASTSASASSGPGQGHAAPIQARETFDESLTLRPLPDGRVSAAFEFKTVVRGARPREPGSLGRAREEGDVSQHYALFPLELGQILRAHAVAELHLGLRAGKWDYDAWGAPGAWTTADPSPEPHAGVGAGAAGAATGAELYAWMGDAGGGEGEGGVSIDDRWTGLRSALAGLFCASLESLDERRTCAPADAFPPSGTLPPLASQYRPRSNASGSSIGAGGGGYYELRHALQPAEHVCTENLTPFVRLLPCKAAAGLGRLLNPQKLFGADWHGLGVHVRWVAPGGGGGEGGVELVLAAQGVFDPVRLSGSYRSRDWSFQRLFDRLVEARCPVARSSRVYVELPQDVAYSVVPEPTKVEGAVAMYDLLAENAERVDVSLRYLLEKQFQYPTARPPSLSPLTVRRALHGTSQAHGALAVSVTNNLDTPVRVGYLETLPALVTLWLHTLTVTLDGDARPRNDLLTDLTYQPPLPHGAHTGPSVLQAALAIPPRATLRLSVDMGKAFLRYTEHQPDAMRGWDLPGAVFFPLALDDKSYGAGLASAKNSNETAVATTIGYRIHTPNLLVDLATPDFSMPYNVIILSCTLITLIFGSVFNMLTRRWVLVDMDEGLDVE